MKSIQKILDVINQNAKKRCIIFASGPSVIDFDFSSLDNDIDIFSVNGSIDFLLEHNVYPDYYSVVDTGFLSNRSMFLRGVKHCKYFFTSHEVRIKAIKKLLYWNWKKYIIIDSCSNSLEDSVLERKFTNGGTVVANAIQILFMLNYKDIYIAGMDLHGKYRGYYEDNPMPSYLDENFHSTIEPFFKDVKIYSEKNGINIFNLSPFSRLDGDIIKKIAAIPILPSGPSI